MKNPIKQFFNTVRFTLLYIATGPCLLAVQGFKTIAILDMDKNCIWSASMMDGITVEQSNIVIEKIDAMNQAWATLKRQQ